MAIKLEALFEGQKLAVESINYTADDDISRPLFTIGADSPIAVGEMSTRF